MKPKTEKPSTRPAKPIEITIAVTKFQDVLAQETANGRSTDYTMKLRRRDPRAYIKGEDIYIAQPGGPIRFTIGSAGDDAQRYYPVGISFVREGDANASERERLGLVTFPQKDIRYEGRTVTITDVYRDRARSVRYKFSVVVQRGSDGRLGIIDPGIVHERT